MALCPQGTIYILRKNLYSTKLNDFQIFHKNCFFRQIKRISFSTLYFDKIFMLKVEFFSVHKEKCSKIRESDAVDKKSAYVIYEWSQSEMC